MSANICQSEGTNEEQAKTYGILPLPQFVPISKKSIKKYTYYTRRCIQLEMAPRYVKKILEFSFREKSTESDS
jgi:hypothetical protein